MTNDAIREHCLSLPMTTEEIQWEEHLLFKIGGKMFAITTLGGHRCNFKCTHEKYAELVEMPDILPSSHNMWKYQWVTTETLTALPDAEFRELLTESYNLVRASLPKRVLAELDAGRQPKIKKWVPKAKREKAKKSAAKGRPTIVLKKAAVKKRRAK
jgi:predicted DNA-binding protein (MmcQ/YjbR family)